MTAEPEPSDDIAELARLISELAHQLEQHAPPAEVAALEAIRGRAERLAGSERGPVRIASLSAETISVVEPDGTLRLLLSSRAKFPEAVQIAGEVIEHRRELAGVLFFSDEGDECGGLVFSGEDHSQGGSLTFDQYHGDQVLQLVHDESPEGQRAGLFVNDQPAIPLPELMRRWEAIRALPSGEREKASQRVREEGAVAAQRVFAGKTTDREAQVTLSAADGTVRLKLTVTEEGHASIQLFDANSEVTWQAP